MTNAFCLLFSSTCNNNGIWALDGAVSALLPVPVRKINQTERKKSTEREQDFDAINNL